MLTATNLFVAQLIAHIAFIYLIFVGEVFHWGMVATVYFFNGCIGMTMTYHRLLSHKAWNPPKWIEYFGALCATIGMTGSAISWVAIHRKHHRHTDTQKDPHSPIMKGFIYCHWFSMFERVEVKYVTDLSRQAFYRMQHKYYFLICALYATFLYALDPFAVVYAFLAPACLLWNAGSSIVSIAHLFGDRPHKIKSRAGNNWLLGLLVWGEGWHNNHHHDAKNPYFFNRPWQVDIGGYLIYLFNSFWGKKNKSGNING
jgi:fatty-acid desaturase